MGGVAVNKDWDYYKTMHIETEVDDTKKWHNWIDKNIESPIEKIAFMYLVFLSNELFQPAELIINRQVNIGTYRVDFMVVHRQTNTWIIIECDGHDFHEKTKEQAAHDKKRDRFFAKEGYIVFRYTGSQICEKPLEIYEDVATIIFEKQRALKESGEEV